MDKIYLLPKAGKFYKACLHTHSNISDGRFSPEKVKELYKANGYSIVAFTDHEVLVPHNDLADENFLPITSYELSINEHTVERLRPYEKCYHFNCFAKDKNKDVSPVFTEKEIWLEHSKQYVSERQKQVDYPLQYDPATVNDMIKKLNDDGFLVCYNHPVWSNSDYADYGFIEGLWGMEIYNYGAAVDGYVDTVTPYDQLLKQGKRVVPLATDDMHGEKGLFGGFIMVKAAALTYENIMEALERGDFYASQGPSIYDLFIEDHILKINCSPCVNVVLSTQMRSNQAKSGNALEYVEFDLKQYFDLYDEVLAANQETYFRITLTDGQGRSAYTKAFFIKDLLQRV